MAPTDDNDPFETPEKRPAVSWKEAKVGTVIAGHVVEAPKLVQSRNFQTGDPDTWPDGNPKMAVVVGILVDGEERSIWAPKPSSMFAALKEAQEKAGAKITEGGTLKVRLKARIPHEKKNFNPRNEFEAKYLPPENDAFSDASGPETEAEAESLGEAEEKVPF